MGILYMNTADVGDHSLWISDGGVSYNTISTDYARTGLKSFKCDGLGSTLNAAFANTQAGYGRVCYYSTGRAIYESATILLRCGRTTHLGLIYRFDLGTVQVCMGTTLIENGNLAVGEGEWGAYEFYWSIADSGGRFTMKENGTTIIDYTGDTRNSSLAYVNNMAVGGYNGSPYTSSPAALYVDDIIIRDDQWPWRGGIHVLVPNADGDDTDWTKSDVLKGYHEHINTQPPDYTDYLETDATVAATKQLTHLTTLADDVWNIRGVGAHVNCKSTVSTDAFVRTLLLPADIGAAQAVGSDFGAEPAAAWARTYYEQNPHDSAAWEKADIDDLQIGVETRVPA